jgi:hypothetical protein
MRGIVHFKANILFEVIFLREYWVRIRKYLYKEARKHWKLKEGAKDHIHWRTQFGRGYGPVARQTTT